MLTFPCVFLHVCFAMCQLFYGGNSYDEMLTYMEITFFILFLIRQIGWKQSHLNCISAIYYMLTGCVFFEIIMLIFPDIYFQSTISGCLLPVNYFRLSTSCQLFPVVYFLSTISGCLLHFSYFWLSSSHQLLPVVYLLSTIHGCLLPVTYFWLSTSCQLLQVVYFLSTILVCLLPVNYFRLSPSCQLFPVVYFLSTISGYLLPVNYFRLSTSSQLFPVIYFLSATFRFNSLFFHPLVYFRSHAQKYKWNINRIFYVIH